MTERDGVTFLYLSQEDLVKCGGRELPRYVPVIEEVFRLHAGGESVQPQEVFLRRGDVASEKTLGRILGLPGYIGGSFDVWGLKWVASSPRNPQAAGLPRASAVVVLNDTRTGVPVAIMDGTLISAMRTAAVTALAVRHLARRHVGKAALLGAGVINRGQAEALLLERPSVGEIHVFDIETERAASFSRHLERKVDRPVRAVGTAEEAVRGADVVIAATTTVEGYVDEGWLGAGSLFCNVSLFDPMDGVFLGADKVIVDDWEASNNGGRPLNRLCLEGRFSHDRLHAELGEIIRGLKPGRESDTERIVFNPMGMAIEDLACAVTLYRRALSLDIGVRLPLWQRPAL